MEAPIIQISTPGPQHWGVTLGVVLVAGLVVAKGASATTRSIGRSMAAFHEGRVEGALTANEDEDD